MIIISLYFNLQTKKDSIIAELFTETIKSENSFRKTDDSTNIILYELCHSCYKKINYLKSNLSVAEISAFKKGENASFKIIAFLANWKKIIQKNMQFIYCKD